MSDERPLDLYSFRPCRSRPRGVGRESGGRSNRSAVRRSTRRRAGTRSWRRNYRVAERLLIYVFVLAGAPSAIGFLVTAKSLFRFGDVTGKQQRRHAEYIIIGTLVSFAYAVTLSYLVRWALRILV